MNGIALLSWQAVTIKHRVPGQGNAVLIRSVAGIAQPRLCGAMLSGFAGLPAGE